MLTKNFSLCLILLFCAFRANAQIGVPNTSSVSESFDGMGSGLPLPTNWKVAAGGSPTYSGGTTSVTKEASSGSPITGGTYNWGNSASERAVGSMTSGTFSNPRSLIGYYRNTNTTNLTALSVDYTAERYRQNSAAASIQFYYSLNGSSWNAVAAGDISTTSFPTGANTYYFGSPSPTINMSGINITGLNIAPNSDFYLRWNINTTGTNSQGIGIDNISVSATFAPPVPDINLQTPVGTNVACGSGTAAFGSINIGSSTTKTIRIQNLGTSALNLTGLPLSITGTNADQFSIVTQPTSPIAVGSFSDMVVQFSPTSNGAKTASISIASNDPDENPCSINLSGTGVSPDINLQTPVGTNVACGSGAASFGNVNEGSSTTKTIRIQNLGTAALNLTGLPLSITGTNADQFSIVTQPTSPIAAGAFSDMVVQFSPTSSGAKTATISIANNDPDENPCSIDLNGTGVALVSDINLQTPVGTNVACGAGTVAFGSVNIGNSTTKTIRIQNLGTGPLNLSNLPLVITGLNADQFSIVTQPTSPIAAGASVDIVVQFAPTNSGTQTATISIASDDPDENPCSINLNGTGVALVPDINLQTPVGTNVACGAGTVAFGSVNIGNSTTKTIRIQNLGTGPLNLSNLPLVITGLNADQFSIVTQPTSPIAAGAFVDMVVQFTPTNNGVQNATISIASDDPDENPCSINLSGTGVSPDINLQTPVGTNVACGTGAASFGSINVGSSTTQTIRIQNLGTSALNLTGLPLSITGLNADQFSIVTQPTSPIAAGSFSDMVVQFSPTSSGVKTATISIANNDPDENPCSIDLNGTGVALVPDINLQTPVGTNVACGAGTVAFGSVNIGNSLTKTIRIQNLGTGPLNLSNLPLVITGLNADQFSIVTQPTSPIAAGAFVDMVVQFTPTNNGVQNATISIASDDPDENPCSIDLNGTGVALVPDINLQSPVGTNVTCGAGTVAFGSVNIGNSTTKTIRIQNLGTGPLNLSNLPLVITGLNADQFSIVTQPTSPIAAGAFVDMVVQFTPTNNGVQNATISIASDDPDENPCSINLSGTGVSPDINLQTPVGTNVACGTGAASFGSINVGSSTTQTIRIQNLGTSALNLTGLPLSITGLNADQFSIVTQPTSPIAAGSFSDMVVQFSPTSSGLKTATISIANNDPDENPCSIDLNGTGVALVPDINLQSPVGTNVTCGAGTVAFGSVNIGNSTTKTIRIQNLGTGPLNLSNLPLVITGLNADQFSIVAQPTTPIAAGAFVDMVVQFAPTNNGVQTATISIASDDPDENPCSIDLNGTGIALVPDISLQTPVGTNVACGTGTVNFGTVGIGSSGTATVRIANVGTGPLNLSNLPLSITGTNANQFNIITQPTSPIAAGAFSDMVLQFTPTSAGVKTASISIGSDDPDENPCTINLSGTGLLQALYFRSKTSGNWIDASTWETSPNNSTWSNAVLAPVNYASDLTVTIQSSHIVTILDDITVDQVVISAGATLSINNLTLLTINNGSGLDLDVQGTFEDGASAAKSAVFASGATWQLGGSGTFLKTSDADMVNYRTNYQGGISNIPASAFWIIRLSSDLGIANPGMYFPNLSLESVSGTVNYNMTGAAATYTVKGNLEVGVTGAGTVNLNNENTYSAAFQVLGNCSIGNRSKITNFSGVGNTYGSGFDLYGDLTIDGDVELNYGNGTSKGVLSFKGVSLQQVTGDGLMFINNLVVNKSGASVNFTAISTPPIVFEQINLISKNIVLNEVDLWLDKNCQVVNASNSSYVQTNGVGTVFRETTSTYPFPVGFSSYNPITITGVGELDYFHARVVDEVLQDGTSGPPFTTNVVDRTWFVTEESTGGNTMNLTMTWYSSDELGGFSRNACYTSHYDGTNWVGTTPASATGSGTGPFTRTRTGQTSFSPFAIGSNGALPIKLLRFTAVLQNKQVNLSWQTATEQDNALFLLEHSTDGIQFTQIGSVPGAGNSQTILSYQFWDTKPTPGINYYRLKQVDYNGQYTYSPVITVQFDGPGGFHLFPVPVKDHLQLQLDAPDAFESQWAVYNTLGQLVLSGILLEDQSSLDINVADLTPGMYWLQRVSGRARSSRMFVKE